MNPVRNRGRDNKLIMYSKKPKSLINQMIEQRALRPRPISYGMNNCTFKLFSFFFLLFFVFGFFSVNFVYANYQKIAPGDTVTLGEYVFDDNFVATTTPCTIGITNPSNEVKVVSTTPMTANSDGWHYYDYTTESDDPSGLWSSIMICGSVANGDLVKADKSFIVDSSLSRDWTVTLSDFGNTTVSTAYKAKLQVLNPATVPTDADSIPTITITDSAATVQVTAASMTKDSDGTYSYSYSISSGAVGGVWESVVSTVIGSETIRSVDYWSVSSSPADIQITEITDKVIPTITASVRIDNAGTGGSDFYYVYCIVNSEDNLCGGGDDIDSASDTAYINAGSFINLSLSLDDVPSAGTYWFKVKTRALAETLWAASTEQFTAESGTPAPTPGGSGGGSGGGGGGGIITLPPTSGNSSDFNRDGLVNSIDFSILLAFWHKQPPFLNPYVDINQDNEVNSVDFSILLYQWST